MSETKELNLRLADLEQITIRTTPEDEANWKMARDQVNNLWLKWRRELPNISSKDILAIIALRFDKALVARNDDFMEMESMLENFEQEIDRMILGTTEQQLQQDNTPMQG